MFNNPTKNGFKVYLPKFLPNGMNDTFTQYFFNETTMPYKDIHEAFFEGQILGYEIPDLGADTVTQNTANGEISQLPSRFTHEKYGDNRIVFNIKCIDAYINYHIARYAYLVYSNPKLNEDPKKTGIIGDIVINFNSSDSLFRITTIYRDCAWVGIDGKEFKYDQQLQRFDTFGLIFRHNGFDVFPTLKEDVTKSKGLEIEIGDVDYSQKGRRRERIKLQN